MKGLFEMKQKTNQLQTKDPVTSGILTALCMAAFAALDVLGGSGPLAGALMPTFTALLCGAGQVQKAGVPLRAAGAGGQPRYRVLEQRL